MSRMLMDRHRILGLVVVMLTLMGLMAYFNMARQEDPTWPFRAAFLTVPYPGATAETVERLVIDPLEEELLQIEEIKYVRSTARSDTAVLYIFMNDGVYDTDAVWDRVRQAMGRARLRFPEGVGDMFLDDRLDTPVVVLSLGGSASVVELSRAAEDLKDALTGLRHLSRVEIQGYADEQITIAVDDARLFALGLTPAGLVDLIASRNQVIPAGFVLAGDKRLAVMTNSEFVDLNELRATQIPLPDGSLVPLAAIAEVWHGPREPAQFESWHDGERVVTLNLYTERGQVDAVDFGENLRQRITQIAPQFAPLEIREMFYQPAKVSERLHDLEGSLVISVVVIVAVVFLGMGLRLGILVAAMLPVVALISLGLYNLGGGVLHQIAVIGLVISLGILIDNGIVMVENIQTRLCQGMQRREAVRTSIRELMGPLGASTATTLAAFLPLLLSRGNTADFTRGIPVMIMLTLSISYLLSISMAPLLAARFLHRDTVPRSEALRSLGERLASLSIAYPYRILLGGAGLVLFSFLLTPLLTTQFFPNADRPVVVLDLHLPEGTDQAYTGHVAGALEAAMRTRADVQQIHRFIGFSGPSFYYNLRANPQMPNRARLVLLVTDLSATSGVIDFARRHVRQNMPDVELSADTLGQGPPRDAPVEVRVFHGDDHQRAQAVEHIFSLIRALPGSVDVRHDLDVGTPALNVVVDDAVAARSGLSRSAVATSLFGQSYGLVAEQYRQARKPMPLVVRSMEGTALPLSRLLSVNVHSPAAGPVPLMQVAQVSVDWQVAGIHHRDGERVSTVYANLHEGYSFSQILDGLHTALQTNPLPEGTRLEFGGDSQGSSDANGALARAAPGGLLLLLFALVWQFNSFRRVAIVLLTVPMAAVGIIPGLVVSGAPFGFMSMLGVVALVGIVVNNAIVLIDVIDRQLEAGADVRSAVHEAVVQRTRPIILTTATTVAGLFPLAFTSSTLWPPMAWAIISGLLASTMLTLLLVPALCLLSIRRLPGTLSDR